MPHDRHEPDSFKAWLSRAESDLAIAEADIPGAYLEDLCYHAQQCVEKAIKSVLIFRVGKFPYIHDLAELVNCLNELGIAVPEFIEDSVSLTPFAVEGRYPGLDEEVTPLERADAVRKARSVLNWARNECKPLWMPEEDAPACSKPKPETTFPDAAI
jgi:HEPN domain-containing protein